MVRPSGWDVLGLDGDPTPGAVESVRDLAKEFGDFAHDVQSALRSLNSFGADATALQWIGSTADAFKSNFGPLPGRLQKLWTFYSEASRALSAYASKLLAAQNKADAALRQAQDAHTDLQRATTSADSAASDLKTAQQNQTTAPNPQAVTDAQSAHEAAQRNLAAAKGKLDALTAQAKQAEADRVAAAKECAKALHHAQSDGIHNEHWWQHVGAALSDWGGKIAEVAGDIAPVFGHPRDGHSMDPRCRRRHRHAGQGRQHSRDGRHRHGDRRRHHARPLPRCPDERRHARRDRAGSEGRLQARQQRHRGTVRQGRQGSRARRRKRGQQRSPRS